MAIRKNIYFDEKEYEKLQEMKLKYGLKSDSAAISFLLQSESLTDEIAKSVVKEFEESYMKSERLKWGVRTAEQNSVLLLDSINTILNVLKLSELISVDEQESPVIKESRKKLDKKEISSVEAAKDYLEKIKEKNEDVIFVGDGISKHKEALKEALPNGSFAPSHSSYPRAASVGELGLRLLESGVSHDLNTYAPIYLRKSQAEREYEERMRLK